VSTRLAVFGDLHGDFTPHDARAVDALGYDGVLFVGDLGSWLHTGIRRVARAISTLKTPALVIPGNHDGPSPLGVLREAVLGGRHPRGSARRTLRRTRRIERWLSPVPLVGYSAHPLGAVTVIAARPWAMGAGLSFSASLARRHGVGSLQGSTERLCALVDATSGPLVFLAHNGPAGLGSEAEDLWSRRGVDLGDADLTAAVEHAGPRAVAVVAGHMHLGPGRDSHRTHRGVLHVNAARVPAEGRHVVLVVDPTAVGLGEGSTRP
jgi:uncharacterized protein (TIGR04168 family)